MFQLIIIKNTLEIILYKQQPFLKLKITDIDSSIRN